MKGGIFFSDNIGLITNTITFFFELHIWSQHSMFRLKICRLFIYGNWKQNHKYAKKKKKLIIFSALLKPILKFLYQNRKHSCIFFFFLAVHRTVACSQCIKMHKIISHNLNWHFTVPSLCLDFSSGGVNSTLMAWLLWAMGMHPVLGSAATFIVQGRVGWPELNHGLVMPGLLDPSHRDAIEKTFKLCFSSLWHCFVNWDLIKVLRSEL